MYKYIEIMPSVHTMCEEATDKGRELHLLSGADILHRALAMLEVFQRMPDPAGRQRWLNTPDKKLGPQRPMSGLQNFSAFYEQVILEMHKTEDPQLRAHLLYFGLRVAQQDKMNSNADFFQWSVDYLSSINLDPKQSDPLLYPVDQLGLIGEVLNGNTVLASSAYVEMCCAYLNIPFQYKPMSYRHPHHVTEAKRIERENRAIDRAHDKARTNLETIIHMYNGCLIEKDIDELFSHKSINLLKSTACQGRRWSNTKMARHFLRNIKKLKSSPPPFLRLITDARGMRGVRHLGLE